MRAVIGIDAAWTRRHPSGVALCVERHDGWHCTTVAPSYSDFFECAEGKVVDWERVAIDGDNPDPGRILEAARTLAPDAIIEAVSIDLPLAHSPVVGRRESDRRISRAYGSRYCSTHSPSPTRPGSLSAAMRDGFTAAGFPLATGLPFERPALLEVYPHPALLSLLGADRRLPYKVSKSGKYWPGARPEIRRELLVEQWNRILEGLRDDVHLELALPRSFSSFAAMKRYEDAIDAVICAWVGIRCLDGKAQPFGDDDSAIWCPV